MCRIEQKLVDKWWQNEVQYTVVDIFLLIATYQSTAYDIANMPPYGDIDASKVDSSGGGSSRMKEEERGEFFFALQKKLPLAYVVVCDVCLWQLYMCHG